MINIEYLQKAINDFEKELILFNKIKNDKTHEFYESCRTSIIHKFGVAREQARKTLSRILKNYYKIDNEKKIFQHAYTYNLIKNLDNWLDYGDIRNTIVHDYIPEEKNINNILSILDRFLDDIKILEIKLKEYLNSSTIKFIDKSGLSHQIIENIRDILSKYDLLEYAYMHGSRAKGTASENSDIDIFIKLNNNKLDTDILDNLKSDFEESDIVYRVDICDWHRLSASFQEIFMKDAIKIIEII